MQEDQQKEINELKNKLEILSKNFEKHQHDDYDGTKVLRKAIKLDVDQSLVVGLGGMITQLILNAGTASEQIGYSITVGKGNLNSGDSLSNKVDAIQLNFLHLPNSTQSFINAYRTPLVTPFSGATISPVSGGNTVTLNGYNFTTNELAGALIDVFSSAGTFIETKTIASNTATVITITGTWGSTVTDGTFQIYNPVYLGSADSIFQRLYIQEGTAGGVRIGGGPTAGGQNGLLYMDATGNLYWRNKGGTSTKLN
jgi:hypothetical protein